MMDFRSLAATWGAFGVIIATPTLFVFACVLADPEPVTEVGFGFVAAYAAFNAVAFAACMISNPIRFQAMADESDAREVERALREDVLATRTYRYVAKIDRWVSDDDPPVMIGGGNG